VSVHRWLHRRGLGLLHEGWHGRSNGQHRAVGGPSLACELRGLHPHLVNEEGAGQGGDGLDVHVLTFLAEFALPVGEGAVGVVGASLLSEEVFAHLGFELDGLHLTALALGAAHWAEDGRRAAGGAAAADFVVVRHAVEVLGAKLGGKLRG